MQQEVVTPKLVTMGAQKEVPLASSFSQQEVVIRVIIVEEPIKWAIRVPIMVLIMVPWAWVQVTMATPTSTTPTPTSIVLEPTSTPMVVIWQVLPFLEQLPSQEEHPLHWLREPS